MISRLQDDRRLLAGSVSVGRIRELLAQFEDSDQVNFERHYIEYGALDDPKNVCDVLDFGEVRQEALGARCVIRLDFAGTIK